MSFFQAIFMAVLQGVTELFPVSSLGHAVILPAVLHWLTGYIGFHHIHHVCSKIPNYRLRECFDKSREFRDVRRLTLLDSLKCSRLSLWDEERQLLVSFHDAFRRQPASEG